MNLLFRFLIVLSSFLVVGCQLFQETNHSDAVARVGEEFLCKDDLDEILVPGLSAEDSATIAYNYIYNWARKRLVLKKAELNLSENEKDVDRLVEEYRNSLVRSLYEKKLIAEYLDTAITSNQIERYYNENKQNFELKENIVRVEYYKFDPQSPDLAQFKNWFRSGREADKAMRTEYALNYAAEHFLNDSTWISYMDLVSRVPLQAYNQEQFLRNNRLVEINDSSAVYFIQILEYKTENNHSPLEYVYPTIKNIILHQRKLDLIKEMENRLYEDAQKRNEFEIYE
jgi:hypothetical protein